jgi:hypothetical protein
MNKVLFVIALSTVLSGCVNDPTVSEALCQAQANDPSATCTDVGTDVATTTDVVVDETETETSVDTETVVE